MKTKNKNYKQILIRLNSVAEIEVYERFRAKCKSKGKKMNTELKTMLIDLVEQKMMDIEITKNEHFFRDLINDILDKTIIPRIYGIFQTINEQNFTKTEMANKKLNFIISELAFGNLVDGRPLVEHIQEKIAEKTWMLDEAARIKEMIQIKKKS